MKMRCSNFYVASYREIPSIYPTRPAERHPRIDVIPQ
jgi:hypothetical protein